MQKGVHISIIGFFLAALNLNLLGQQLPTYGSNPFLPRYETQSRFVKNGMAMDRGLFPYPTLFHRHQFMLHDLRPYRSDEESHSFFNLNNSIFSIGNLGKHGMPPLTPAGVREDWVRVYEANLPSYDVAMDIAVDDKNNIYVTGCTTNFPNGLDFYTIKYDASGNEVWSKYFDGEDHGDDLACRIALDDSGNVYVGGRSRGVDTHIIVVKYNTNGEELQIARNDGYLENMVVDAQGNVYIIGDFTDACRILKYNNQVIKIWETDCPSCMTNWFKSMAVDGYGNVYMTGEGQVDDARTGYITVKYDSEGLQLWVAMYSRHEYFHWMPTALVVDDDGNVFVTGWSVSDENSDYATVKYDEGGQEIWAVTHTGNGIFYNYDIAFAISLDDDGNVYITGHEEVDRYPLDYDIATVKYSPMGEEQWVVRYGGHVETYCWAGFLNVDVNGRIIITGFEGMEYNNQDIITIAYSSDGHQLWCSRYDGPGNARDYASALAVNADGDMIITGGSVGIDTDSDYTTFKYDSSGNRQWERRFDGNKRELGRADALIADDRGHAYVSGSSGGAFVTIEYSSQGEAVWTACYDEGAGGRVVDMALDHHGNVYITGEHRIDPNEHDYDFLTIKYDSEGREEWTARYDRQLYGWSYVQDFPTAIAVDCFGHAYVTGSSPGGGSGRAFVTIKYSPQGVQEWIRYYTSGEQNSDEATDVAVDDDGSVYVLGNLRGVNPSFTLVKYNTGGHQEWVAYNDGTVLRDTRMALDNWGNIILSGRTGVWYEESGCYILKYDPDGVQLWTANYEESNHAMGVDDIIADMNGDVYITGRIRDLSTFEFDFYVLKYNSEGGREWMMRYDEFGTHGSPMDIALDKCGNVYVAGYMDFSYFNFMESVIIKYNPEGALRWIIGPGGSTVAEEYSSAIDVDALGNVYVAGRTEGNEWSFFKIWKYTQTGEDSLEIPQIEDYHLYQNFPNPFNVTTEIRYDLPMQKNVKLTIYNLIGQVIKVLVNETQDAGAYAYKWDGTDMRGEKVTSGIYLYRIEAGYWVLIKKMMLLQ